MPEGDGQGSDGGPPGQLPDVSGLLSDVRSNLEDVGEVVDLLEGARNRFARARALEDLPMRRLMVVGDVHGHLGAALWVAARFLADDDLHLVGLGDYVDRGAHQLETLAVMLTLQERRPARVTLLRGNHETEFFSAAYGFHDQVLAVHPRMVLEVALDTFAEMPLMALRGDGVLCLHGGIPEGTSSIDDLRAIPKGGRDPGDPRAFEVLMNDPEERPGGFQPNHVRGLGKTFGLDATRDLMGSADLRLLVRSHQFHPRGCGRLHGGRVLSIFSSPGYMGRENRAAVAVLDTVGDASIEEMDLDPA